MNREGPVPAEEPCVLLRNKEAHVVTNSLVDHFFLKFGLCQILLSDLGNKFEDKFMSALTQSLEITKIRMTLYRPQLSAISEVFYWVLNIMFPNVCIPIKSIGENGCCTQMYLTMQTSTVGLNFHYFRSFFGRMPIWIIHLSLPQV